MACIVEGIQKTGQATAQCGVKVGDDLTNASAGAFAHTPGTGGPATKGVVGAVNAASNGNGLSLEHVHIAGLGGTTTVAGQAKLHQSQSSSLNATGFHIHGPTHDQFGGGLNIKTAAGHKATAGGFASKPGAGGPVTKGVYGEVNANGHGLSLQHVHVAGWGTTTAAGQVNLHQSRNSSLNATGFHIHGPTHDEFGGGLNLQTSAGQGALGFSRVPQFDVTTMQASGRANLYTNGNLNLNATGNANYHLSGPWRGKSDFGTGLNLRYDF